jgi:hypothetical protein
LEFIAVRLQISSCRADFTRGVLVIRVVFVWLLVGVLAACSPTYNWREIHIAEGAVTAFFPDRAVTTQRELQYEKHAVEFAMTSASVDGGMFTVAYAALPPDLATDESARAKFVAAVVGSLYRNLGVKEPDAMPALQETFVIEGNSPNGPLRLEAKVWLTDKALVEGLVTAAPHEFPEREAAEFLNGVVLKR